MGRPEFVVQHRIDGTLSSGLLVEWPPGVEVAVEAREATAGHYHAEAMPRQKGIASSP